MRGFNHERMRVLLTTPQAQDMWMDGLAEEVFSSCKPYSSDRMRLVQSG